MDIKAIIDGILAVFGVAPTKSTAVPQAASSTSPSVYEQVGSILPNASTFLVLLVVVAGLAYASRTSFGKRARDGLDEAIFTNWRLALLATTGLVLSLASGWTTWDGMRNFTGEPVLSLMITFGIQGVMLIVAWLIGESFAVGMNQTVRPSDSQQLSRGTQTIVGAVLGILFAAAIITLVFSWSGVASTPGITIADPGTWASSDKLLFLAIGVIIVAAVLLTQQDVISPYLQGGTVILRNMVLWVMFLACMATSVFFSFDSLFSVIFPQDERKRAADIRSINQVSGVVADVGTLIARRRTEQAEKLFQSKGWENYEKELDKVAELGRRAPEKVREQMEQELQQRNRRISELQEKKASAKSGEVALASRKVDITDELGRLEAKRPAAAQLANEQKKVVAGIEVRLDEQRAKVLAEEKGVEGSGKAGRGRFWRATKAEESKIRSQLQVAEQRLKSHTTRLDRITSRISAIKRELATIDGEIAKYKGSAQTVDQMMASAKSDTSADTGLKANPIALVSQMSRDLDTFRLDPQEQKLSRIQQKCQLLVTTSARVASLRNEAAAVDCDPKQATQTAASVFALNAGAAAFVANCSGGDKMPNSGGTDALLAFGRKCLQDSGLPSRDTSAMGAKLAKIDLSRDDKAHRFVVTWNAFNDGNSLAYLALAIAVAIDSLVFMSGLFGANAVRSPLSDVPSERARSARQLEAIIDTALMPHPFETSRLVLGAMKPMTQVDGFMARITLHDDDPHAAELRRVLNAGTTIGAVRHDEGNEHDYHVRAELFEYLSHVAKREFEANAELANLADLERTVTVALLPEVHDNVEIVLHHLHPIEDNPTILEKIGLTGPHGFVSEINLDEVEEDDEKKVVRSVLNAGATAAAVQRVESKHYYIHRDLYKTLVRIRARSLYGNASTAPQLAAPGRAAPNMRVIESPAAKPIALATNLPPPANDPRGLRSVQDGDQNEKQMHDFISHLIATMGVDPLAFRTLDAEDADAMDAAQKAGKAIRKLRKSISEFDVYVHDYEAEALDAIKSESIRLKNDPHYSGADAQSNLKDAQDYVLQNFDILALMPDGPYEGVISRIITDLEADSGAGRLEEEKETLYKLAKNLRPQFFQNSRKTKDDWELLSFALDGPVPDQSEYYTRQ